MITAWFTLGGINTNSNNTPNRFLSIAHSINELISLTMSDTVYVFYGSIHMRTLLTEYTAAIGAL